MQFPVPDQLLQPTGKI